MTDEERKWILEHESELVNEAIEEAVARAIEEHRRLGNPIAVWQNGQVVWIPPEEIEPYEKKG